MADRELVYRISVSGQSEARSAIRSIVQEANRQQHEEIKVAREVERAKVSARRSGATESKRITDEEAAHNARVGKTNVTLEKLNAKERERDAKALQKSKERGEADTSRFLFSEWRKRQQEEKRIADQRVRDEKRSVEEIARFKMQAEANTSRHIMSERAKVQQQAERDARQLARDHAFEDRRLLRGIGGGMYEGAGNALKYGTGLLARGVRDIASGTGLTRGFDVQGIVSERMLVDHALRSVRIEARNAGGEFTFDEKAAKQKIAAIAGKTGYSQTELVGAIDAYSEKGSGATGVRDLEKIAMQARAMDTDPAAIARLRANLELKGMKSDQIDSFMARAHFVGKSGVFRAADLAEQSEQMLASFGPNIVKGGNDFLGLANEVRKSTGGGAQARTAFDSAFDALDKKRAHIEGTGYYKRNGKWETGLGIKYEENGEARSKVDIIKDVIAMTGGDKTRLTEFFDPSRSGKGLTTLVDAYAGAAKGEVGSKEGMAAMTKLLEGDESLNKALTS